MQCAFSNTLIKMILIVTVNVSKALNNHILCFVFRMKVVYIGTASCYPTPTRNVSCTALQLDDGQIWIFDCGECTQVQLQKSILKPGKITKIFITHLHGDHLFGLPGLLCTLGNGLDPKVAEKKVVDIYGPHGLKKFINTTLSLSRSPLAYTFHVHEMIPEPDQFSPDWQDWPVDHKDTTQKPLESKYEEIACQTSGSLRFWPVFMDDKYDVKAAAIKHRIPCFGFVIQERDQVGTLDVEKARALGIKNGIDFGRLKKGEAVIVPGSGVEVQPEEVLGDPKKGRKVVVLGDTCDTSEIVPLSHDANYVVHEATMEESMREKAIEYGHSTPHMAAEFAMKVNAKKLCLTHLSPRYKPVNEEGDTAQILLLEAQNYLKQMNHSAIQVEVAQDFYEDTIV